MRDADVEKKRETGREMRSYGVPTKRRRPFQCLVSSFSGRRTCTAHPAHGNANHLAVGLLRRFTSIKITPHRPNEWVSGQYKGLKDRLDPEFWKLTILWEAILLLFFSLEKKHHASELWTSGDYSSYARWQWTCSTEIICSLWFDCIRFIRPQILGFVQIYLTSNFRNHRYKDMYPLWTIGLHQNYQLKLLAFA
jgi:hypothetical protein